MKDFTYAFGCLVGDGCRMLGHILEGFRGGRENSLRLFDAPMFLDKRR